MISIVGGRRTSYNDTKGLNSYRLSCGATLEDMERRTFTDLDLGNSLVKTNTGEMLKRGSVYQSSNSVRKMDKMGLLEEKKRISSRHSDISVSYSVIDSLSRSTRHQKFSLDHCNKSDFFSFELEFDLAPTTTDYAQRASPMSLNSTIQRINNGSEPTKLLQLYIASERCNLGETSSTLLDTVKEEAVIELERLKQGQPYVPKDDWNPHFNEELCTLWKSLSEKVGMSKPSLRFMPSRSLSKSSAKARFGALRNILEPMRKSKSERKMPVWGTDSNILAATSSPNLWKSSMLHKPLLPDFSKQADSLVPSYATHLNGLLKLEHKNGIPNFRFVLKEPPDVLSAKTWKTGEEFNWVYTFHSSNAKKKSESSRWSARDRHKQSSMLCQMQVSCYLCSEIRNGKATESSTMLEFVLYDIAHQEKNCSSLHGSAPSYTDMDGPPPQSWLPRNTHSHIELAATMIQLPIQDEDDGKDCQITPMDSSTDGLNLATIKVITPNGLHGLPTSKESKPSSLLDRWRSGGICDCGGWDMNCPIKVLDGKPRNTSRNSNVQKQRVSELYFEGIKGKIPALAMRKIDASQYAVDFHAQLSSMQAFSICVALLHSEEISAAIQQDKNRQRSKCSPLNIILDEELRQFVETVAEEERRKSTNKIDEILSPFTLDPPVSPTGRA